MSLFDVWAEYYDLLHKGLEGEAEFYVGHAVKRGGDVLELGCGTGRLAIPMAMSGLHVVGVDNSRAMLERCREKLDAIGPVPGSLHLIQGDMAELALDREFDFIAMAYRTFMHLMTPDDQRRCLRTVRRHLNAGGFFIMNTWIPRLRALIVNNHLTGQRMREVGRYTFDGSTLVHRVRTAVDEFRQLLIEEHEIEEIDERGSVLDKRTLPMVRTWTTLREMRHLVEGEGFFVEAVFGDFEAEPVTEHSTDMVWVLRKSRPTES